MNNNVYKKATTNFKWSCAIFLMSLFFCIFLFSLGMWIGFSVNWSDDNNVWKAFVEQNKNITEPLSIILCVLSLVLTILSAIGLVFLTVNSIYILLRKTNVWIAFWTILTLVLCLFVMSLSIIDVISQFSNNDIKSKILPSSWLGAITLISLLSPILLLVSTYMTKYFVKIHEMKKRK